MKIIRVLPGVYNEIDILQENLDYYVNHGFETVVVDNGSTDGSWELIQGYLGKGIVAATQIRTADFNSRLLMRASYNLYKTLKPDWIILADADEFIEPPSQETHLRQAITDQADKGYTCIAQSHFIFHMTEADDPNITSTVKRMNYYSKADDSGRIKVWKDTEAVDLIFPHCPEFLIKEEKLVSPQKLVLRHYPFRSLDQARSKLDRVKPSPDNPFGWNMHYYRVKTAEDLIRKSSELVRYEQGHDWNYKVKLVSDGANIPLSEALDYYASMGKQYIEVAIERICRDNLNWQHDPFTLKLLGDIHEKAGDTVKAAEFHATSKAICQSIISELK